MHRTPDSTTLPPSPSQPKVINTTETTVTLSWSKVHSKSGSAIIGYSVEYFSSDLQTGWVLASHRESGNIITVSKTKNTHTHLIV